MYMLCHDTKYKYMQGLNQNYNRGVDPGSAPGVNLIAIVMLYIASSPGPLTFSMLL